MPSRVEGNFRVRKCRYRHSIFPFDRDSEILSIRGVREGIPIHSANQHRPHDAQHEKQLTA